MDDNENPELDYYLNQDYSDVVFVVDGKRLPANKTILSFKSRVFRAQFSGKFADSEAKEITITDSTVIGFKIMLKFLYTEELCFEDNPSVDLVLDVYNLSQKYQLERLANNVEKYVNYSLIDYKNFADICILSSERKFDKLVEITVSKMAKHLDIVLNLDYEKVEQLNNCTNNEIFKVIFMKYRDAKSKFTGITKDQDHLYKDGVEIACSTEWQLHTALNFNFDNANNEWPDEWAVDW